MLLPYNIHKPITSLFLNYYLIITVFINIINLETIIFNYNENSYYNILIISVHIGYIIVIPIIDILKLNIPDIFYVVITSSYIMIKFDAIISYLLNIFIIFSCYINIKFFTYDIRAMITFILSCVLYDHFIITTFLYPFIIVIIKLINTIIYYVPNNNYYKLFLIIIIFMRIYITFIIINICLL